MKPCNVVPFPLARRLSMIRRQAEYAARLRSEASERHIQQQLKIQAEARRKGVDENLVQRELRSMDLAIRSLLSLVTSDIRR